MRGRTPIQRDYTLQNARRDLANGVHFGVVSCRLGVSEEDLALALDLSAADVLAAYLPEIKGARQ
jgi:hypothetical protein